MLLILAVTLCFVCFPLGVLLPLQASQPDSLLFMLVAALPAGILLFSESLQPSDPAFLSTLAFPKDMAFGLWDSPLAEGALRTVPPLRMA